jgi:hypothetical protein
MPRPQAFSVATLIWAFRPYACCDSCIAAELRIDGQVAEAAARAVADQSGFRRRHGACFNCGRIKDVTESTEVT